MHQTDRCCWEFEAHLSVGHPEECSFLPSPTAGTTQLFCNTVAPPEGSSIHSKRLLTTLLVIFLLFCCKIKELKQMALWAGSSVGRWMSWLNSPLPFQLPWFCESQIAFAVEKSQGKNTYLCVCVMLYEHMSVQLLLHAQLAEPMTGIFIQTCK